MEDYKIKHERFVSVTKEWTKKLQDLHPKFCDLVKQLTKEWNESNAPGGRGSITCEFSTDEDMLREKMCYLRQFDPKKGYWRISLCETCFGHHEDQPFHVEIINEH